MASAAMDMDAAALTPAYLGIRALAVTVHDIDAALADLAEVMPLGEVARIALPAAEFGGDLLHDTTGDVRIASVRTPTGFVQFLQFPAGPARGEQASVIGPGYTHYCLQSAATDPALPRLLARGYTLESRCDERGVDIGGYGVRYAYVRDHEGRMIEVEMLDEPRRAERGWISHLANTVHDHAAMLNFYTRLLGIAPHRTIAQNGRPKLDDVAGIDGLDILGAWFRLSNLEIEVWQYRQPATPQPRGRRRLDEAGYGGPLYEVADLAAETARLAALGVELVGPRTDIGGWTTQFAADPEGNLFAVQQQAGAPQSESVTNFHY